MIRVIMDEKKERKADYKYEREGERKIESIL